MDTTTTEKGDTINNDDFLMRDWEQKELRNIDQLKKERTALCERFAKAETWDKKYRLILDFAARQDSPRSRKKRLNETVLTCIPEAEMPPSSRFVAKNCAMQGCCVLLGKKLLLISQTTLHQQSLDLFTAQHIKGV